ncbi:hypothetical protein [Pseudomonas gessardii]|nr:hypothetical protein [Pseudomonas gessardii]NNA93417.1 hypothetical protein [Pseudomonas gessardii]
MNDIFPVFKYLEKAEIQDGAKVVMDKSIMVIGGESAEEMTGGGKN